MLNSNYLWIAFMCVITLVIMLLIMPGLIDYLHKIKFGQTEREEGLASHKRRMVRQQWEDLPLSLYLL